MSNVKFWKSICEIHFVKLTFATLFSFAVSVRKHLGEWNQWKISEGRDWKKCIEKIKRFYEKNGLFKPKRLKNVPLDETRWATFKRTKKVRRNETCQIDEKKE